MGGIESGKYDIYGKETELKRTYFYYPIHCECSVCILNPYKTNEENERR